MEVILLERVAKLGQMGEVVRVKDGFARNFLLKRGKALRATADNRAKFDGMKAELEARNLQAKGEATKVAEKIDGRNVVVLRQASETGQLFGSVTVRDIIASFEADGVTISRSQVMLDAPIKTIGKHKIAIAVHPEVEVGVTVTVARSADEAERINRGEDISHPSGRSGRGRRSARRRRRILRSGSPPRRRRTARRSGFRQVTRCLASNRNRPRPAYQAGRWILRSSDRQPIAAASRSTVARSPPGGECVRGSVAAIWQAANRRGDWSAPSGAARRDGGSRRHAAAGCRRLGWRLQRTPLGQRAAQAAHGRRNRIGPKRAEVRRYAVSRRGLHVPAAADLPSPDGLALAVRLASRLPLWRFRCWAVSSFAASLFAGSSLAASVLGGSSVPGLPRLLSFCLAVDLRPSPRAALMRTWALRPSAGLARPRQPLGVAARRRIGFAACWRLGIGPGGLLRGRGAQPAAEPVELLRRAGGLRLRILPSLPGLGLGADVAGIGRAIGNQEGAEQRGHVAGGGVMLAQEARQRTGRHGLQQTPRALVAGVAGACENLGRALAGLEILRLRRRDRRETADQKRHRR